MNFLTFLINNYTVEILFCSATLFFLIFDESIISYNNWKRPILIENSFSYCMIVLVMAAYFNYLYVVNGDLSVIDNTNTLYGISVHLCKLIVFIIAIFTLVLVKSSVTLQKITFPEFYFFFMISVLCSVLLLNANDLIIFYLLLESQTLSLFILACANRNSIYSIEAGLKYYLSSSMISCVYLLGVALIYICYGSVGIADINQILFYTTGDVWNNIGVIGSVLVLCVLIFKVGLFPFHFWLPDVYEGAPLASTIIFSILPKFSIFHFFAKYILAINIFNFQENIGNILLTFGILSMVVGTFFALKQSRIKRIIAYSSVVQVGYITVALAIPTATSYAYAFFYIIIYVLNSVLIWSVIILIYHYQKDNKFSSSVDFESLTGISKYTMNFALLMLLFVTTLFSISGIPPFVGFTSKLLILNNLMEPEYYLAAIFILITSSISVFYYIRLLKAAYFENLKVKNVNKISTFKIGSINTNDNTFGIHAIIIFCILLNIFLFIYPNHLLSLGLFIFESVRL